MGWISTASKCMKCGRPETMFINGECFDCWVSQKPATRGPKFAVPRKEVPAEPYRMGEHGE